MLFLLTGCVTPEQQAANMAQQEIAECQEMGFKPDTPDFANCRLQVRNRIMTIRHQAVSGAMDDLSRSMNSNR